MKPSLLLLVAIGIVMVTGCATTDRLAALHIGMTRDEVVAAMGKPDSIGQQGPYEYLNYYLYDDAGSGFDHRYVVRLVSGKVEILGRLSELYDVYNRPPAGPEGNIPGAYSSGPSVPLGVYPPAPVAAPAPAATDLAGQLRQLKALKDEGVITDSEFQKAKDKLLGPQN